MNKIEKNTLFVQFHASFYGKIQKKKKIRTILVETLDTGKNNSFCNSDFWICTASIIKIDN